MQGVDGPIEVGACRNKPLATESFTRLSTRGGGPGGGEEKHTAAVLLEINVLLIYMLCYKGLIVCP
jgi:hypothetical protein